MRSQILWSWRRRGKVTMKIDRVHVGDSTCRPKCVQPADCDNCGSGHHGGRIVCAHDVVVVLRQRNEIRHRPGKILIGLVPQLVDSDLALISLDERANESIPIRQISHAGGAGNVWRPGVARRTCFRVAGCPGRNLVCRVHHCQIVREGQVNLGIQCRPIERTAGGLEMCPGDARGPQEAERHGWIIPVDDMQAEETGRNCDAGKGRVGCGLRG